MVISSYFLFGEGYNMTFIYASEEKLTHSILLFLPPLWNDCKDFKKWKLKHACTRNARIIIKYNSVLHKSDSCSGSTDVI